MKPGEGNAITGLLESAINRYLAEDPTSAETITQLESKLIELQLQDLDFSIFIRVLHGQVLLSINEPTAADSRLSGSPLTLTRFFLGKDTADTDVMIFGDHEPAETLRALLSGIDIDWEEHLSRIVGDVAAHRIGRQCKQTSKSSTQKSRAFISDIADYLHEETQLLVHPIEQSDFAADVTEFSAAVDQMAARLDRLTAAQKRAQP